MRAIGPIVMAPTLIVDGRRLRQSGTFECPFCTGSLASYAEKGEDVALVHTMPYCETFDRLDVSDFVHEAAKKLGLCTDEKGAN